ncbi:hypothetical protein ABB02_01808 [Clostridiaceae bacterium JG1575]|nr:hypothetical protein ABB02_01808 [Clostridiaceae bacterium JG1575]
MNHVPKILTALMLTALLTGCGDMIQPIPKTQGGSSAPSTTGISEPTPAPPPKTQPKTAPPTTPETQPKTKPQTKIENKTQPTTTIEAPQNNGVPEAFKQRLDEKHALLIVYEVQSYPKIQAKTSWNIVNLGSESQMLVVTKKKGSKVQALEAELKSPADIQVAPGKVVKEWTTTEDFEVLRVLYTDPETIPFHFLRITEPDGQSFTMPIYSSMREHDPWEVYPYSKSWELR